jgi:3-methyladenine DNA glycosylase/8-oxoguanine DNA glycosylase
MPQRSAAPKVVPRSVRLTQPLQNLAPRPSALPFDVRVALAHLRDADARLSRWIERIGPFRLKLAASQSPFSALAESIVYQQLTGRAAATIHSRLVRLFRPRRFPAPGELLAASDAALRGAGLSRAKVAALRDLAARTLDGTVPPMRVLKRLGDEEIVERLTQVRGIGRWTVEMLLIFRLGRPDVLPATDYGVRKGVARAYGMRELPSPKELLAFGEKWRPYRSVASWYFWRVCELPREA